MDGNDKAEVVKIRLIAEEFADFVRTGFLSHLDATMAVHSAIMKTLEYPMAAITLTKKQREYVMAPILMSILPRMGFVRTLPRAVVYGPEEYLGLGIMHSWYNQNLTQLQVIMTETMTDYITGNLIYGSLEKMQLEVGLPGGPGDWDLSVVHSLITDCWLRELLLFMNAHELQLLDDLPNLELYRPNDRFLMQAFCAYGYRGKELEMLNECRKWHRVTTLAEISNANGRAIEEWAWKGEMRGKSEILNTYDWPCRQELAACYWQL